MQIEGKTQAGDQDENWQSTSRRAGRGVRGGAGGGGEGAQHLSQGMTFCGRGALQQPLDCPCSQLLFECGWLGGWVAE